MSRLPIVTVFALSVVFSLSLMDSASAIVPQVQNVVPYPVDSSTYLNITVYHYPEDATGGHYVNVIMVTMGTNSTSLTIGALPLSPGNTFNVQYDLGPIPENSTVAVEAHCLVNGWSAEWKGTIPEFPVPTLLLALVFATSFVAIALRKIRRESSR